MSRAPGTSRRRSQDISCHYISTGDTKQADTPDGRLFVQVQEEGFRGLAIVAFLCQLLSQVRVASGAEGDEREMRVAFVGADIHIFVTHTPNAYRARPFDGERQV